MYPLYLDNNQLTTYFHSWLFLINKDTKKTLIPVSLPHFSPERLSHTTFPSIQKNPYKVHAKFCWKRYILTPLRTQCLFQHIH